MLFSPGVVFYYVAYLAPVVLPLFITFLSSTYDGTFNTDTPWKQGRFSAKICLSQISFDIWGLTNALQGKSSIPLTQASVADLSIVFIMILVCHLTFHGLCLNVFKEYKHRYIRLFFVFLSISIPVVMVFQF